ncbi:MAG: hypothetical protein RLZZ362_1000, partial [Actinomycetota bacterium]
MTLAVVRRLAPMTDELEIAHETPEGGDHE